MDNYVDYPYYSNTYKGDMLEIDFNKVITRASMEVRKNIFDRDIIKYEGNVKSATCSVADILNQIKKLEYKKELIISDKSIKSESVKDYSRTFETTSISDIDKEISNLKTKIKEEIRLYLLNTGLMYRGL